MAILYELEAMTRRRAELLEELRRIQAEREAGGPPPDPPKPAGLSR